TEGDEVGALKQSIASIDPGTSGPRRGLAGEAEAPPAPALQAPSFPASPGPLATSPGALDAVLVAGREVEVAERGRAELAESVTAAERAEQQALRRIGECAVAVVRTRAPDPCHP